MNLTATTTTTTAEMPPSPTSNAPTVPPPTSLEEVLDRLKDTKSYNWLQRRESMEWLRSAGGAHGRGGLRVKPIALLWGPQ